MKYPRPPYGEPGVKTEISKALLSAGTYETPVFDTPITPVENFRRAAQRQNPLWVPNSTADMMTLMANDVAAHKVRGMQIHSPTTPPESDYEFKDWFNTEWVWVPSAGGAMLKPGTQLLEDITQWERDIVWPDLTEWGFDERAADFMKNNYKNHKAMHYDLGRGCTERLVSLMGGYTEAMLALAVEPEAIGDFFNAYADFMISFIDKIASLYPLDMLTLHDDWGTEKDTFFSERMMDELVFEPTKRIIDHIKSKNIVFQMHSCGNVTRFMPYMASLGVDFVQLQRRAVDLPAMKQKYENQFGFNAQLEGIVPGAPVTDEQIIEAVHNTVNTYGHNGGLYLGTSFPDPKQQWVAATELYAYSREYYETAG